MTYYFYVDGSCDKNSTKRPGPAGAGIVGRCGRYEQEWSIPLGKGTNNQAELLAVYHAIQKVKHPEKSSVYIYSDSEYTIGVLVGGWTAKANQELIAMIKTSIASLLSFTMSHVKGHEGNDGNERAHSLAYQAMCSSRASCLP